MDRQTDRQTDIPPLAIPAVCITRYANALVIIMARICMDFVRAKLTMQASRMHSIQGACGDNNSLTVSS